MLAFLKLLAHRSAPSSNLRQGRVAIALMTFTGR
jgi:hypothetical protein